ncbi:unnamed protein product [Protopolystoma xenopodis]|uniref:Uncharacterized protein n=1 Tax=Protopolystoma xenopodis TaxID=117903 RepID=A0A3S4ZTC5_9PLAT|nr:unnamed protein product [Protopolystoma xenopodis]
MCIAYAVVEADTTGHRLVRALVWSLEYLKNTVGSLPPKHRQRMKFPFSILSKILSWVVFFCRLSLSLSLSLTLTRSIHLTVHHRQGAYTGEIKAASPNVKRRLFFSIRIFGK